MEKIWKRSKRCSACECVEASVADGVWRLRDSKQPDGPVLTFTHDEIRAFVAGVIAGDFHE